jgi:hypothetical protein
MPVYETPRAVVYLSTIHKTRLFFRSQSSADFMRMASSQIEKCANKGQWFVFANDPQKREFYWNEDSDGKYIGGRGVNRFYFERDNEVETAVQKNIYVKAYEDIKKTLNQNFSDFTKE